MLAVGSFVTAGLSALPALARAARRPGERGREHGAVAVDVVGAAQPTACRGGRCCPRRSSAAIGLELLKVAGRVRGAAAGVERSSALYGTIGVVFALLAWLLVLGRLVVFVTVIEVDGWERRTAPTRSS